MGVVLPYVSYNTLVVLGLFIILLIWNMTLSVKLGKLKKRFYRFSRGSDINNLEQVIQEYVEEIEFIKNNINKNTEQISIINNKLTSFKGKVEVLRYNAFGEEGNDLSYSIAILDENKNGLVISSIYNRGESNTYAKPIREGTSSYKLSKEEVQVIEKAMRS